MSFLGEEADTIILSAFLFCYLLVFVPLIYGLIKSRKLKLALIEAKEKFNPQVKTNKANSERVDESSTLKTEHKLKELKDLYDRRLISKKIYEEKQKELIAQL
jgi:hypothetical protein